MTSEGSPHNLGRWSAGLYGVPNLPLITRGADLGELIVEAALKDGFTIAERDVLVVAQKIVSKAEGAVVRLADVEPSPRAVELAESTGRDPRLCEVYLRESDEILGTKGRMVITRHRLGFICTGAGVDRSNIALHDEGVVVLLPRDPDRSARQIRQKIKEMIRADVGVIISDSFGKPDREGSIGIAIGIAGIRHLEERRQHDLFGNQANSSIALVDELAAAASLIMGQANESRPVVVVRGIEYTQDEDASIKRLLIE